MQLRTRVEKSLDPCLNRCDTMSLMQKKSSLWLAVLAAAAVLPAQDRIKTMPGYEQHRKVAPEIPGALKSGALTVTWKDDTSFEYSRDGKLWNYDVTAQKATVVGDAPDPQGRGGRGGRAGGPARGRQGDSAISPDGKWKGFYRKRNIWLGD